MSQVINLKKDISGEDYFQLIDFLSIKSKKFCFIIRDDQTSSLVEKFIESLKDSLIKTSKVSEWPGTKLIEGQVTQFEYNLTQQNIIKIKDVGGLYNWIAPYFPEDVFFKNEFDQVLLGSISHEKDAWLELSENEILRENELINKIVDKSLKIARK
ncbi:MAG: hypothetical protein AABY53_02185 [Bdellovibrionota bacterium]